MEANLAEPGYSLEFSSPVPIGYVSTILFHLVCVHYRCFV